MSRFFSFRKKPWDKVACEFVIQEYGAAGEHGWADVSEKSGEPISISEAEVLFKPGCHYRCMARAVEEGEGFKPGLYVGQVWKHYEPLPGGVSKVAEKPKTPKTATPKDPAALLDDWAEGVSKQLKPIATFGQAVRELREALQEITGPSPQYREASPEEGEISEIPPIEFEGKAPWFFHPTIAKTLTDQVKEVIDYGAKRFEQVIGKPSPLPAEEEERPLLPRISEYAEREEEVEAVTEEVGEGLPPAPSTEEAPAEEEVIEAETVPSLLEEGTLKEVLKPCARCGRTDRPLLPNGLCEPCAKELAGADMGVVGEKALEEEEDVEETSGES